MTPAHTGAGAARAAQFALRVQLPARFHFNQKRKDRYLCKKDLRFN
nr:MAG TPA: hypothetical protein [Caudoviricetes sp.]